MKDIWNLMDAIHGKTLRPFIILMVLTILTIWGDYLFEVYLIDTMFSETHVVQLSNRIGIILSINIIILFVLHIKSQSRFAKSGGLKRKQLLPIKPYSYLIQEIIYTLLTLILQCIGVYIAIGCIYVVYGAFWGNIAHGWTYMILNNGLLYSLLMPLNYSSVMLLFTASICFSTLLVTIILSIQNGNLMTGSVVLLLGLAFIGFIGRVTFMSQSYDTYFEWLYSLIFIILSIVMFARLQSAFKKGKVGG